jgi:hypothetical protein
VLWHNRDTDEAVSGGGLRHSRRGASCSPPQWGVSSLDWGRTRGAAFLFHLCCVATFLVKACSCSASVAAQKIAKSSEISACWAPDPLRSTRLFAFCRRAPSCHALAQNRHTRLPEIWGAQGEARAIRFGSDRSERLRLHQALAKRVPRMITYALCLSTLHALHVFCALSAKLSARLR